MRICQVVEASGGGAGRSVMNVTRGLVESGDDVTLIYSPVRADKIFLESIEKLGKRAKIATLKMQREVGFYDFLAAWRLYRLLRQLGPFDIIYSHSSKAGALSRIAGLFIPDAVQVYSPRAFITMAPEASPVYGWIELLLSFFCDKIVTASNLEFQHGRRLKISEKKMVIIYNGADVDYNATKPDARKKLAISDDFFVIGFVGRLVEQKNPMKVVETFRLIASSRNDIKLVIVGDGPFQHKMEKKLAELNLSDRVLFVSNVDARDLMPGFDCLLCTSDYENFGNIFLESLVAGVPVVTTPVGAAPETVINGVTGFISKDFLPENLVINILNVINLKPEERMAMQRNASDHVKQFSASNMVKNMRALFQSLLAERVKS